MFSLNARASNCKIHTSAIKYPNFSLDQQCTIMTNSKVTCKDWGVHEGENEEGASYECKVVDVNIWWPFIEVLHTVHINFFFATLSFSFSCIHQSTLMVFQPSYLTFKIICSLSWHSSHFHHTFHLYSIIRAHSSHLASKHDWIQTDVKGFCSRIFPKESRCKELTKLSQSKYLW